MLSAFVCFNSYIQQHTFFFLTSFHSLIQILIIDFEVDESTLPDLRTALRSSNLTSHVFRPTSKYVSWPTMQSLTDDNTRLLLFAHGEGMTSCYANECEDGILYARDHFAVTATNDVESCEATLGGDTNIGFFQMKNYYN